MWYEMSQDSGFSSLPVTPVHQMEKRQRRYASQPKDHAFEKIAVCPSPFTCFSWDNLILLHPFPLAFSAQWRQLVPLSRSLCSRRGKGLKSFLTFTIKPPAVPCKPGRHICYWTHSWRCVFKGNQETFDKCRTKRASDVRCEKCWSATSTSFPNANPGWMTTTIGLLFTVIQQCLDVSKSLTHNI